MTIESSLCFDFVGFGKYVRRIELLLILYYKETFRDASTASRMQSSSVPVSTINSLRQIVYESVNNMYSTYLLWILSLSGGVLNQTERIIIRAFVNCWPRRVGSTFICNEARKASNMSNKLYYLLIIYLIFVLTQFVNKSNLIRILIKFFYNNCKDNQYGNINMDGWISCFYLDERNKYGENAKSMV